MRACVRVCVIQLIVKHDGSRVVQTCIQYGTEAHRKTIHEAFRGRILELAQDKFAHHLIYKLFKYGAKHQLDRQMLPELMGSFVKLAKNKVPPIYPSIHQASERLRSHSLLVCALSVASIRSTL